MSATKPADLALALQKAMEGFTAIVDRPTENDLIEIRKLLVPVLMKTKYDRLTLTHNLSGVILPSERYEQIYKKGAYVIPPAIALYDETIKNDATRIEVHRAEGKHKSWRNDRQLYETADNSCRSFIMAVMDEAWYKDLEDPDTFYTKVTALKLLDNLTEFCAGLHTVDAVNIPQINKSLYKYLEGVPQFINVTEVAQQKSKRAKLVINDKYMHDVALKSLLQLGEYERKPGSGQNSLSTNKPGKTGRIRFARPMSQRGDWC